MKNNTFLEEAFGMLKATPKQIYAILCQFIPYVAAIMGRLAYIETQYGILYASILMNVLGATGAGKGTLLRFVQRLIQRLPVALMPPTSTPLTINSHQTLIRDIDNTLKQPSYCDKGDVRYLQIMEEAINMLRSMAMLIQSKLPGSFCNLLDGSPINEIFGRQNIDYPTIHFTAIHHYPTGVFKTTIRPQLIADGSLNRGIYTTLPEYELLPLPYITTEVQEFVAQNLVNCLKFCSTPTRFEMSSEAKKMHQDYEDNNAAVRKQSHPIIDMMTVRFPLHVLKIALVIAFLKQENPITEDTIRFAIDFIESTRPVIKDCFVTTAAMTIRDAIMELLRAEGAMTESAILGKLNANFKPKKIKKMIQELQGDGLITQVRVERDGYFPMCYVLAD